MTLDTPATIALLLGGVIILVLLALAWHDWGGGRAGSLAGQGGFVGAMGQHPRLVPCAFPTSSDWQMNRCNYM
jgi:hypothetical protein